MNVTVNFDVTQHLELFKVLQKQTRDDAHYLLLVKISGLATVIFASLWVGFLYLKAVDPTRVAFYLTLTALATTLAVNAYYLWIRREAATKAV